MNKLPLEEEDEVTRCRRMREEFDSRFKTLDEMFDYCEQLRKRRQAERQGGGVQKDTAPCQSRQSHRTKPPKKREGARNNDMKVQIPLEKMTVAEKLRLLERISENLCRVESAVSPPVWRKDVLAAREARVKAGREHFSAWPAAKRRIREASSNAD